MSGEAVLQRSVIIIGGGPAGLMAAEVLAQPGASGGSGDVNAGLGGGGGAGGFRSTNFAYTSTNSFTITVMMK